MKLFSLKNRSDHARVACDHVSAWICLPLALGVLVHATMLLTVQMAQWLQHAPGAPVGVVGVYILGHIFIIATHEGGHYLGAWFGGMRVYKANVGPVEFLRDAAAWRIRIAWPKGPAWYVLPSMLGGALCACPDPAHPSRRQYLCMLAGGPAANFVCAAALWMSAQTLPTEGRTQLVQAFAYLNFASGLINLVPSTLPCESDGRQLLNWLMGPDLNEPGMLLNRLAGMSMHGLPDPELLRRDIEKLNTMPDPMPLIHLFFEMKALQFSGAWQAVAHLAPALDEHLVRMGPRQAADVATLIAMFRCEIDFSRALVTGTVDIPLDRHINADIDWIMPCLRPRCLALDAALRGLSINAQTLLNVAHERSMRSLDHSLRASEDVLHAVIRDRLHRQGLGPACPTAGKPVPACPC